MPNPSESGKTIRAPSPWTARLFAYGEDERLTVLPNQPMTYQFAYTIVTRKVDDLLKKSRTIEKRVSNQAYTEALNELQTCSDRIHSQMQPQNTPVLPNRQEATSSENVNAPSFK